MLLFYTLWSSVESGAKRQELSGLVHHCFDLASWPFDRSLFTLWVLFSEKGTGWTSKVLPKPTPSASVSLIILVWGPCCHLLEIRFNLGNLRFCWMLDLQAELVRMGRGWNLLCWGWGLQREFLTGVTDGERQVTDNAITQKVGSMDPNHSLMGECVGTRQARSRIEDRRV